MKPNLPKNPKIPKVPNPAIPIILTLVALVSFFGGAQYQKSIVPSTSSQPSYPSQATVSRVIDGDTIEVVSGEYPRCLFWSSASITNRVPPLRDIDTHRNS